MFSKPLSANANLKPPTLAPGLRRLIEIGALLGLLHLGLHAGTALAIELPKGLVPETVRTQINSIGAPAASSGKPASSAAPSGTDWAARLDAARAQHQQLQLKSSDSEPLLPERTLAAARRLMLLSAQLQTSMEPSANANAASGPAAASRTPLPGLPPYSMIDVDALRDQLDALLTRQSALKLQGKALDAEVAAAVEARNNADATLRRRKDQAAQLRLGDGQKNAAAQLELSQIQAEVADLELLQADQTRSKARDALENLSQPIAWLQAEVDRVSPHQELSDTELRRLTKEFAKDKDRATAERIKLEAQMGRLQSAELPSSGAESLRLELEAMRMALSGLRELESLAREKTRLWQTRQAAWAAGDSPEKKQAAAASLTRGEELVLGRLQGATKQGDFVRAELRSQEARVQDMPLDDIHRAEQQRILTALQTQLSVQERLIAELNRAHLLLTRSRADMGLGLQPDDARSWLRQLASWSASFAATLWNYELFSATENTQIDGNIVTVDYGVTVGKSLGILIMLGAGYGLSRWLSSVLINQMARRLHLSAALARVLRRWLNTILLLVVLMIVLKLARIPITAFAFLGGALAIGVGFGAQNVIKNLISGIIILFERKIRVGDIVSVGGISGTVQTVDLRATTLRGFDGIDAIVPNSTLLENQVSNWNGSSPDIRRVILVGVAYGSDVRRATQLITDCAANHPSVLQDPPPEVFFDDFAADALSLRLQFWFRLNGPRSGAGVDSDLRFAINDALAAAGISIAFPQRDVHLDLVGPIKVALETAPSNDQPATPR
ncbi:mechanosensitive ion channel domain-containing protein [Roseateles sp. PN1]|uniref:mechanosensitive ion channel domain-containing protein n=1 Tax=Roseateles sp. PN1 TaxID=3137372 RepID=UPI003139F652